MSKTRVSIPLPIRRKLLIDSGYKCSVPRCSMATALEFHHIDGDPSNNCPENILILCANHHSQVTAGIIDKLACAEMKRYLSHETSPIVDHQKLAALIAESLVQDENWPEPLRNISNLNEVIQALYEILGVKSEMIIKANDRLIIWIIALPNTFEQVKSLLFAIACIVSSFEGVNRLEIGLTDTSDFVRTTGGDGICKLRILFPMDVIREAVVIKRIPPTFWSKCLVLITINENEPFMKNVQIPVDEYEVKLRCR